MIIVNGRINLAHQLGQSTLSDLVPLSTRQVGDVNAILGKVAGQDQCLLKLQVIVLCVDVLIFVIFTL